jgi:hypothetical protein
MMVASDGFQPDLVLAFALSISLGANLLLAVLAAQAKRRFTIAYDTRKFPKTTTPSTSTKLKLLNLTDPVQVFAKPSSSRQAIKPAFQGFCFAREYFETNILARKHTSSESHFFPSIRHPIVPIHMPDNTARRPRRAWNPTCVCHAAWTPMRTQYTISKEECTSGSLRSQTPQTFTQARSCLASKASASQDARRSRKGNSKEASSSTLENLCFSRIQGLARYWRSGKTRRAI